MKRVTYAGDSFVTSDRVADALLDLTAALGRSGGADTVDVPVFDKNGESSSVRIVIGPASQVVASPEQWEGPDPSTDDQVAELRARIDALRPISAVVASPEPDSGFDLDNL